MYFLKRNSSLKNYLNLKENMYPSTSNSGMSYEIYVISSELKPAFSDISLDYVVANSFSMY